MSQLFLPLVLWGTVHCVPLCELYPDRLRPNSAFFSPATLPIVLEKDVVSEPEKEDGGLPQHP